MKKSLILSIFIVLFVTVWCLPQKSNIPTFDQSLNILHTQSNDLFNKYVFFLNLTWILNQNIKINISSTNNDSPMDLYLKSTISLNSFEQNYNSHTEYDLKLFDKNEKQKIISSWNFFYSNMEYVPYFKLNKFSLDMWTWNIESSFLQSLLWWITDKRIMIDIQNKKNLMQNYIDINYILNDLISLSKCQIFNKISDTIYKSKRAYKIWLNLSNIEKCINNSFLDYTWIIFEWFLTPLNNRQVSLEIKKLQIPSNKDLLINWEYNNNSLNINIYNKTTKKTEIIDIKYNTKHDKINFKSPDAYYQINIDKIKNSLDFDWILSFLKNDIKQTKTDFDIKWNLDLQNTWYLDIKAPQNYIIMSQLLWDKFSLKNIINN